MEMYSDNYSRTYLGKTTCDQVEKAIAINRRARPISKDRLIALMRTENLPTEVSIYHIDTYSPPGEIDEEWYSLLEANDRNLVLGRLFDLSLTHNIVTASTWQETEDRLCLFIAPSKDGQSNIDADVIEFIMNQGEQEMMYTDEQIDRMIFPAEKKHILAAAKKGRRKASELCLYLYDTKQHEDGKWFQPEIGFYDAIPFDGHHGQIVAKLAELSITHTIVEILGGYDSVSLFLRESPDHQTNIDADVIEAIAGKEN